MQVVAMNGSSEVQMAPCMPVFAPRATHVEVHTWPPGPGPSPAVAGMAVASRGWRCTCSSLAALAPYFWRHTLGQPGAAPLRGWGGGGRVARTETVLYIQTTVFFQKVNFFSPDNLNNYLQVTIFFSMPKWNILMQSIVPTVLLRSETVLYGKNEPKED
jgi:hypothetical protein